MALILDRPARRDALAGPSPGYPKDEPNFLWNFWFLRLAESFLTLTFRFMGLGLRGIAPLELDEPGSHLREGESLGFHSDMK